MARMMVYLRVVPGFWIAVEELQHPELRYRPVVMGGRPAERGAVHEANMLAQCCGVRAGMTLSQAHQQCPQSVFLVPDPPRYGAVWEAVCEVLRRYTPLVEPIEMGQAVCDLSGCERQWTDAWSAASALAQQVQAATGITPWLGVASNRLVAQLASMTVGADGISVVESGKEQAFLADLPLTLLPDVDPRLALSFQVLGLRTIGQFAALPALSVRQRFGDAGEQLHRYARGIDPRPVVPPTAKPSVVARYECDDGSLEEAMAAICRLSHICAAELQRRQLAGRLVELTLLWEAPLTPPPPLIPSPSSPTEEGGLVHIEVGPSLPLSRHAERGPGGEGFPVPYRIHSMLPQPDSGSRAPKLEDVPVSGFRVGAATEAQLSPRCNRGLQRCNQGLRRSVAVRTAIDTAPLLAEQAQRLLLRMWVHPHPPTPSPAEQERGSSHLPSPTHGRGAGGEGGPEVRGLQAIELRISEFEPPAQLSFAEFNRLDQTGKLGGMSSNRLQALTQEEQILAARYGEAMFRHVVQLDPDNVLAERRFRWQPGLGDIGRPRRGRRSRAGVTSHEP